MLKGQKLTNVRASGRDDNVLLTPHALCWTDECFDAIAREGLGCIVDCANARTPKSVIRAAS